MSPHEIVTAKTRARLLSSVPLPGSGSRVLLLDLHTEGIPFYFEGALRPVHLSARPVVLKALAALGVEVVGCTDAGRAKWVERFANDLGVFEYADGRIMTLLSNGIATNTIEGNATNGTFSGSYTAK